jgi:hypothetical protein
MPYALGGARLEGSRLVRIAYLDESGTNRRDKYIVVAGVVVDGDRELAPVEDRLEEIVRAHIPRADWEGFVFHTVDIWNNRGYFEDKALWPWERREPILWDLVNVIRDFQLPVAFGFKRWADKLPDGLKSVPTNDEIQVAYHGLAYLTMTVCLERVCRNVWPDEYIIMIAEDRQSVKTAIKELHAMLRSPTALERDAIHREYLPLKKIKDTTHFASKPESRHLQLADVCAYFIRAYMAGSHRHIPFYGVIRELMLDRPVFEDWPRVQWPLGPLFPLWVDRGFRPLTTLRKAASKDAGDSSA